MVVTIDVKVDTDMKFVDRVDERLNRSFSRDVTPFPVGHIGVPLSIA